MVMQKVVAVMLLKAVVLGGPGGPEVMWQDSGPPGILTDEWARARLAYVIRGDKLSHDSAAGLTVVVGPENEALRLLFEDAGDENLRETILGASQEGDWPQCRLEFPWPETGPAYYLEPLVGDRLGTYELTPNLYRRVELADKGGYSVSVQPTGSPANLSANVELTRKVISGGTYDDTIRAYIGRPIVVADVVMSTVPIEPGRRTLLIWQGDRQLPEARRAALLEALTAEQTDQLRELEGLLTWPRTPDLKALLAHARRQLAERLAVQGEDHPEVRALKARIESLKMKIAELAAAGAAGVIGPPPAWAVGEWTLVTGRGGTAVVTVRADGSLIARTEDGKVHHAGPGSVDAEGRIEFKLPGGEQGKAEVVSVTGQLRPDGTGSGTARLVEGDAADVGATVNWTATRPGGAAPAGEPAMAPPPPWAVGTWQLRSPEGEETPMMAVRADGSVTIEDKGRIVPGSGFVDGQGQVHFRLIEAEGVEPEAVLVGQLRPDGTGSGTVPEENATWTATRVAPEALIPPPREVTPGPTEPPRRAERPLATAAALGDVAAAPTPQGPAGMALLLEVAQPLFGALPEKDRPQFQMLGRALEAATGGQAQLDLERASWANPEPGAAIVELPTEGGIVTVVPVKAEAGKCNPPTVTLEGEDYMPLLALLAPKATVDTVVVAGNRVAILLEPGAYLLAARPDDLKRGLAAFALSQDGDKLERVRDGIRVQVVSIATAAQSPGETEAGPGAFAVFESWQQPSVARFQVLSAPLDLGEGLQRLRLRLDASLVAIGPAGATD